MPTQFGLMSDCVEWNLHTFLHPRSCFRSEHHSLDVQLHIDPFQDRCVSESSRVFTPFPFDCSCVHSKHLTRIPSLILFPFPLRCLSILSLSLSRSPFSLFSFSCELWFRTRMWPMLLPRARRRMTASNSAWGDGTQSNVH